MMKFTTAWVAASAVLVSMVAPSIWAQPKTREDVRAEAASAAKAGLIDRGEVTKVPPTPSSKSRAEVKADTRAAVKAGAIDHGEVTTAPPLGPSTTTRAEVKAEAASAIHPKPPAKAASKVDDAVAKKP